MWVNLSRERTLLGGSASTIIVIRFFGWVQNKINGRQQGNQKTNTVPAHHNHAKQAQGQKEEFNDWPHGLLTIGTFGNNQNVPSQNDHQEQSPSGSPDLSEFTPEEVGHLQKELTKLLKKKPAKQQGEENSSDLPLDRFLNCPSSLEVSRRISNFVCNDPDYKEEEDDLERTISVIIGKCKEVRAEKNKNGAIGKKSLTFLLKKIFVCSSGFAPSSSLRDPLQESRMEKLLRTILRKKIYQQNHPSRASSMKRFIEDQQSIVKQKEDDDEDHRARPSEGSKWDKTDSEYIVLEI